MDAKGSKDDPLISRFTGSWLIGFKSSDWEQAMFPASATVKDGKWAAPVTVEGKVTRLFYLSPVGKSPLEVFRNYQSALTAAGFKQQFSCESSCSDLYFGMDKTSDYTSGMTWANGSLVSLTGGSYSITHGALSSDQGRMWYGKLSRASGDVHVLVYTSIAENETTNTASTFIQIAQPKAMPTGQVQVDAKAMAQGLSGEGKIALYGLYFDTGKADIKPESKAQLAEMASLLKAQPALKVFIVGHTDNQGSFDANMALSNQRAQAVAAALASEYKVDPKRLVARGVGNLSPLSSNDVEDGRAKNRRVELVKQ